MVGTVYKADVRSATNVLNDKRLNTLDFEDPDFDFDKHGINLLAKEKVLEYPNEFFDEFFGLVGMAICDKIEGIAKVDNRTLAMINDNDYGKMGDPSIVYVVGFEDEVLV